MTANDLRQLSNDELDTLAALRLGGGVACETAAQVGRGFVDGRVVVYPGADRRYGAHTADGLWSPTRDGAAAYALEREVRRRGLEAAYVAALADLAAPAGGAGGGPGGELPRDARGLFALVHASPRNRTIAVLVATGVAGR